MASIRECGVYIISNTINNKIYIGSSNFLARRFSVHKTALRCNKHQNKHMQAAWNKYGEIAFDFKTVLFCSIDNMRFYEQLLIDAWKPDYNQSKSAYAGVPLGSKLTKEHKEKVGIASKRQWNNETYRVKVITAINEAMTEKERSERSDRAKKLWANPEYRAKAIAVRKGNAYCKGYKCTPEQIINRKKAARISNMKRNYGKLWQEEYRKRYPEYVGDLNGY